MITGKKLSEANALLLTTFLDKAHSRSPGNSKLSDDARAARSIWYALLDGKFDEAHHSELAIGGNLPAGTVSALKAAIAAIALNGTQAANLARQFRAIGIVTTKVSKKYGTGVKEASRLQALRRTPGTVAHALTQGIRRDKSV